MIPFVGPNQSGHSKKEPGRLGERRSTKTEQQSVRSSVVTNEHRPQGISKVKKAGVFAERSPFYPAFDGSFGQILKNIGRQFDKAVCAVQVEHLGHSERRFGTGRVLTDNFGAADQFSIMSFRPDVL